MDAQAELRLYCSQTALNRISRDEAQKCYFTSKIRNIGEFAVEDSIANEYLFIFGNYIIIVVSKRLC